MYEELEKIKRVLISDGKYQQLTEAEKFILDLPLVMWAKNWKYGAIFMYNWIIQKGDIKIDSNLWSELDRWGVLNEEKIKFLALFNSHKNKLINSTLSTGNLALYSLKDVRELLANHKRGSLKIGKELGDRYTNFSNLGFSTGLLTEPNDPYIAAWGSIAVMFLFEGEYDAVGKAIKITKIYEQIKDGFNFSDDSWLSQPLGAWNRSIFQTKSPVNRFSINPLDGYINLSNKIFRSFSEQTGLGQDFRIIGHRELTQRFISKIILTNSGVIYE